jgi:integrase/recombinase XerD
MAAADTLRSQALIWLLLDSGARLGEVTGGDRYPGICLDDIDFQTGAIRVRGKFQLERQVHISPATIEAIQQYLDHERSKLFPSHHLFLNDNGTPLKAGRAQKILEAIGKKAHLKQRLSPHKLRHTHAVLSLKYGSNVEYQRRELGHRHISTTQGYLAICDDDLARAHRSFSPVTNLLSQQKKGPRERPSGANVGPRLQRDSSGQWWD